MNPIIEAVAKLAPDYELTPAQLVEIERNAAPVQTAKNLPSLVQSMAESYAKAAPRAFDWRLVPVEWMIDAVDFERHTTTAFRVAFNAISKMVGREHNFQMGVIAERAAMWGADHEIDRIVRQYQKHQNRLPDHAGLMFWLEALHKAKSMDARSRVFEALVDGLT